MGVAHGVFFPEAGYALIRDECIANHADHTALELSAKTSAGTVIECAAVGILDYSTEAGESFAEANVLGIPYPLYGELFPSHVKAYDDQFKANPV
ncbi:hypothetical protein ACQ859_10950 [Roseateles chitinivorans]|uniref:hypothetical protein n=1 Tax=Roseateles chitinivorans TaxID=2917965 RepID=UPI003D67C732